jgi:hypothetical protein
LEELRELFLNHRIHTGKGYHNANKAVRGCVACGEMKTRQEFSRNQWTKGPDVNKCINCVNEYLIVKPGTIVFDLISGLENTTLNDDDDPNFPALLQGGGGVGGLTLDNLKTHNKINNTNTSRGHGHQQMEPHQFNFPTHLTPAWAWLAAMSFSKKCRP